MPDAAEFDALSAEFYQGWFHFHPDQALRIGVPVAGRLLPAHDADELAALGAWLEELLLGLDEIAFTALDTDRQLDWELMAGAARVEYRELRDRDGPDPLQLLPLAEIAWLSGGDEGRSEVLGRLLHEVPGHLRQAQAALRTAAPGLARPLVRAAADQARGLGERLRALGLGTASCHGLQGLDAPLAAAAQALADYGNYLAAELAPRARGPLGSGVEHLGLRLRLVHFVDGDPADDDGPLARALREAAQALGNLACGAGRTDSPPTPDPTGASPAADGRVGDAHDPVHPRHLPRRLANATSLTAGWRLYQGLHPAAGPGGQRPLDRAALSERLLCARLDLDLHRGRCDGEQALARLHRHGYEGPAADARLARIGRHPGDALAAVFGWWLLEQMLGQRGQAAGMALDEFHDRLFSRGAIPLPLALRYAFA